MDVSKQNSELPEHRGRKILFRLTAIAIGVLPFLLCEIVLWLAGWQPATEIQDPYVGFSEVRPLFEKSADGTRYEIPEWRQVLFRPESFDVEKRDDEFRIFCLGGSTVQGRPFAIETSFTSWLEISLQAADESRNWQVINCGGVSYASYRLHPMLQELIQYQPDLIVLYTGHNEFLEERTYEQVKRTPGWVVAVHDHLSAFRTYSFLRAKFVAGSVPAATFSSRTELPADVEAILDFRGGLARYHRDSKWKQDVARHFELNLKQMVTIAKEAEVPLIVFNPACRLKDCAPFKSELDPDLSPELAQRVLQLRDQVQLDSDLSTGERIDLLREALAIDDGNADIHQRLGDAYYLNGDTAKAKQHYLLAKDSDVCPLRILEPMREPIFRLARQRDLPLVDAQSYFESLSPAGITGSEFFLDHVHPTIYGHQLIAELLAEQMQEMDLLAPKDNWKTLRDERYLAHLSGIDPLYFQLGKQRLEGLQRWSQGKVRRLPKDEQN